MFESYRNVDVNDDPIIIPACGHILTVSSMDGLVQLADHYELDLAGVPIALKSPELTLDSKHTQLRCPTCRKSLRHLERYGRMSRRGLLIETTLKFITSTNQEYREFFDRLMREAQRLDSTIDEAQWGSGDLVLGDTNTMNFTKLRELSVGDNGRYKEMTKLHAQLCTFVSKLHVREQPFQRVKELVEIARLRNQTQGEFTFDPAIVLQTRAHTLAWALLRRCELVLFSDLLKLRQENSPQGIETAVDFAASRADCRLLGAQALQGNHIQQQAEALLFEARFAALELAFKSEQ